jgi:hypothetical protein
MMVPKVSLLFSLLLAASNCYVQAQQQQHYHRPRRGRRLQKDAGKKDALPMPPMPPLSTAPAAVAASLASAPTTITAIPSFVEECVAVVTAKSEFVETNKSVMVRYEYEVLVLVQEPQADSDVDLARIASAAATVDEAVQNYLIQYLMLPLGACKGSRRLQNNYRRHLQGVSVTAIKQGEADTVTAATCIHTTIMQRPVSALEICRRVEGSFRVYLREDQAINMDDVEAENIRQEVLDSVKQGFQDGLIYLGGGSTLAAHYLGPAQVLPVKVVLEDNSSEQVAAVVPDDTNTGTADSSIVADQGSQQEDDETTGTPLGKQVDDAAETMTQGNPVDDVAEITTLGNQVDDAAETTPTTTQGNQVDDTTGSSSIPNTDTSLEDSQILEIGLEQPTSIANPSPDNNSSDGLFSVTATIFLTLGGILGLVGAAIIGKQYYRRTRFFGRGVDKNFDDDSLDGHEQFPAVNKFHFNDTTMNTSSAYSANEPGTEDFLRDLEDFKTFDSPGKGSNSGSINLNLSGDADILNLSLVGMMSRDVSRAKDFT